MELSNKQKAVAVIRSLETGEQEPVGYINPNKYIQHNLAVGDGLAGFGAVLANAPAGGFKSRGNQGFPRRRLRISSHQIRLFWPKSWFLTYFVLKMAKS